MTTNQMRISRGTSRLIIGGLFFLVLLMLVLAACSQKQREPFRDAPTAKERNTAPAVVIEMPDGFSNVATKCDHGNRVYVAFKGDGNRAALAVVPDAKCGGS